MTLSPRLLKGGLVQMDPDSGRVLRVIALQYNPDTLTRTLQVQATGETRRPLAGAAAEGRRDRDDQARGRDRRDRAASTIPRRTRTPSRVGIHPQLAALEDARPSARRRPAGERRARERGRARGAADRGAADALRLEQAARRAGARDRRLGDRGGVRRRAQPDPREGEPRPARALGRRPRLRRTAAARSSWRTCGTRRRSPGARASVQLSHARRGGTRLVPDPLQELLAAGAVPTTSFPPTSRYSDVDVDAWDPGHGLPPAPFLRRRFCPRPERFALLYEVRVVEGDRRDLLAARHVGDRRALVAARRRERRRAIRATLTEPIGRTVCASRCRRASREPAVADQPVRLQLLDRRRRCRCRCRAAVLDARAGGQGRVELGRDAERLRDHVPDHEPLAAAHALPAHRRRGDPDPPRRHRRHRTPARRPS